jgi:hypothetical protein
MRLGQGGRVELHEILTGLDISALLVDHTSWWEDGADRKKRIKDLNDYLQLHGWERTTAALKQLEEWAIPGLPAEGKREGRARLWFPSHDWYSYTRYRVREDFTRAIDKRSRTKRRRPSATCTATCAASASPP